MQVRLAIPLKTGYWGSDTCAIGSMTGGQALAARFIIFLGKERVAFLLELDINSHPLFRTT
jgi:hypothetical protein